MTPLRETSAATTNYVDRTSRSRTARGSVSASKEDKWAINGAFCQHVLDNIREMRMLLQPFSCWRDWNCSHSMFFLIIDRTGEHR